VVYFTALRSLNTFLGTCLQEGLESTGFRFFGTSAAAPNVAAVGLLMLQVDSKLTPNDVYTILSGTAIDMGAPGFDFDTGAGFVNAKRAIDYVIENKSKSKQGKKGGPYSFAKDLDDLPFCVFTDME
jgi:Subtilase family